MKPCPFDGGTAKVSGRDLDERYEYGYIASVSCQTCGATISIGNRENASGWNCEEPEETTARAVEKWNKRI